MVKILNVAEKNDAAKSIAALLSKGTSHMRNGYSVYNKIYEFDYRVFNQQAKMVMTSVSGHLLGLEFSNAYRSWKSCDPLELFSAPVHKYCPEDYEPIKRTIEREIASCQKLIIWTDCDREGENIGYEIIDVCLKVKPNLDVWRAQFSELTGPAVARALNNLVRANKNISDAVDARMELDLRIGASFTRFQTLRLQRAFPNFLAENMISYGSCQFPTLGFVVERFKERESFQSEPFWRIVVQHEAKDGGEVEFAWERVRLFDFDVCSSIFDFLISNPNARVLKIETKPKSKWRPTALDTVELEKSASRKLRINAKETMKIAEKLYTQGLISYPRTETNIFPKELNLANLVEIQCNDPNWGGFAQNILNTTGPTPRNGSKTDQAHPPIHPTKYTNGLDGNERKIYEFIVRQFLACCSADARGFETTVYIEISQEKFSASGLMITERNYLDVYPYEKWSDKEIPVFEQGQEFIPKSIQMKQGRTEAAKLLTEADLIALMEKHGIGTDATHAEHIETIKERRYVVLDNQNHFIPAELGLGLVEGYDSMGYQMAKPNLRAALESDLKAICEGRKTKDEVLLAQVNAYRVCFEDARRNVEKLDEAMAKYFGRPVAGIVEEVVFDCSCKSGIVLRQKKDGVGYYLSCRSFPDCKVSVWFPASVKQATVLDEYCQNCLPRKVKKINFKLERGSVTPTIPLEYSTCILCDEHFKECLGIDTRGLKTNSTTQQSTMMSTISNNSTYSPPTMTIGSMNRTALPQQQQQQQQKHQTQYRNNSNFSSSASASVTQTRPAAHRGDVDDSNPVVCNCGRAAVLLTVRKEGPNQGRQFYKCEQRENACDFFLWHDSAAAGAGAGPGSTTNSMISSSNYSATTSNRSNYSNSSPRTNFTSRSSNRDSGFSSGGDGLVKCDCNADALLLTTNKPGPNQGRKFFKCKESVCKFFKWEDEATSGGSGGTTAPSYSSGHGNRDGGGDESASVKKRKCGVCGQEGHNRKNCPQLH